MNPAYNRARFITSARELRQAPPDAGSEVAFVGRSNAGKSSAINTITGIRGLAHVSKTPGRTQLINFFEIDAERRLVDLPGYGYAKVPGAVKDDWQGMIERYLFQRRSLRGIVVMMDVRHPLTAYDRQMLQWCQHAGLAVHVLLTKADKLSRGAAQASLHQVRRTLDEFGATVQLFSALKRQGIEQVHGQLDDWFGFSPKKMPQP